MHLNFHEPGISTQFKMMKTEYMICMFNVCAMSFLTLHILHVHE